MAKHTPSPGGARPLGDGSHLNDEDNDAVELSAAQSKITGEELRERMARRRDAQRNQRAERQAKRHPAFSLVRTAVTVVAIAGAIGSVFYIQGTAGGFDEQTQANAAEISELEASLEEVTSSPRASADAATINNGLVLARERAQALADIQNGMAETRTHPDMSDDEAEAVTEEYSVQVDNAKSYLSRSAQTGGTFAPQQRWLSPAEFVIDREDPSDRGQIVPLPANMYTWTSRPTHNVDPETTEVRTLWTANMVEGEDAGQLLAWVTGSFNPSTGSFSSMRMALTPFGEKMVGATVSPPEAGYEDGLEEGRRRAENIEKLLEIQEDHENSEDGSGTDGSETPDTETSDNEVSADEAETTTDGDEATGTDAETTEGR